MRIRAAQLACLLLLLTSVGAANASTRRVDFSLGGHFVSQLLQTTATTGSEIPSSLQQAAEKTATQTSITVSRAVWTMRPPAAHSIQVHAVTGSGI
jgi:hypothetical protein